MNAKARPLDEGPGFCFAFCRSFPRSRLLPLQAKFGLPLAYVTTGQRVPDDIVLPDAHAIASCTP